MTREFLAAALLCVSTAAHAGGPLPPTTTTDPDPSVFLGLTWTFGAGMTENKPGLSLKLLSTNERNHGAATAGVTWNFDGTWGCDIGLAYNDDDATVTATYDFCQQGPQIGIGATSDPDETTTGGAAADFD